MAKFDVGDRVVNTPNRRYPSLIDLKRIARPFGAETIYEVTEVEASGRIRVVPIANPNGPVYGTFTADRFTLKQAVPKKETGVDNMRAMTVETAREQRRKLIEAGVPVPSIKVRTRSWDADGSFFAVEVAVANPTGGTASKKALYVPKDVDAFIETNITPTNLVPFQVGTRLGANVYQFRADGRTLTAPDGSLWFSVADIKSIKGIAVSNGKRYRLGTQQFVPFVS